MTTVRTISLAALCALVACTGDPSTQVITGRVDTSKGALAIRAIADGQVVTAAPVRTDGSFTIALPAGSRYRLEVLTRHGVKNIVTRDGKTLRDLAFKVCEPVDPWDCGDVGDPGTTMCNPGDPMCDQPPPTCDPTTDPNCKCFEDGTCCSAMDPNCVPPPTGCTDPMDPNCMPPGCTDPMDPTCGCQADGTCCAPGDPNCPPPCMDPTDPNCQPPPPKCDAMNDPDCMCFPDGTCCSAMDPNCPTCNPGDPSCTMCTDPMDPACCAAYGTCPPPTCDPTDPNCMCDADGNCTPPCTDTQPDGTCTCTDTNAPGCAPPCENPMDPTTCKDPCLEDPMGCGCPDDDPMCWPQPEPCDSNGMCDPGEGMEPDNVPGDFGCEEM